MTDTFELTSGYDRRKSPKPAATFRRMTVYEAKRLQYGDHVPILANDGTARRVKINGRPKTWKRSPGRVAVPLKYGIYEYATAENLVNASGGGGEGGPVSFLLVKVDGPDLF